MPYGIAFFAILMIVAGIRGKERDLGALLQGDFIGKQTFLPWMGAIVGIGAIGYFAPLKKTVDMFLALLLIVLVLDKNGGVFSQLQKALTSATTHTDVGVDAADNNSPIGATSSGTSSTPAATSSGSSSSSSGSTASTAENVGMGMAQGAAAGAVAGPYGMVAGAAIGGIMGGLS